MRKYHLKVSQPVCVSRRVRETQQMLKESIQALVAIALFMVQISRAQKAQERGCIAAWRGEVRVYLPQPALPGDAKENVQAQRSTAPQQRQQPHSQRQQPAGRPPLSNQQQKPPQRQAASKAVPGSQQQGATGSRAQAAPLAERGQGTANEPGRAQRPGQGPQPRRPQQAENQPQPSRTERDRDSSLQVALAPLTELQRSPHLISE